MAVENDDDRAPRREEGGSAIDALRRRFDYRFQQKQPGREEERGYGSGPAHRYPRTAPAGGRPQNAYAPGGRPQNTTPRFGAPKQQPDPALVRTPRPSTEGMRRIETRPATGGLSAMPASAGEYAVGQRVEHPKFGVGIVRRIEVLAGDHKLVIAFDNAGEKTLLAKFAKLTKL